MQATIFGIKRFAVHDGDGIRTTVFFKGCPLSCRWCHNPEGICGKVQVAFYAEKCVSCGKCAKVCDAQVFRDGTHAVDREKCTACGKCVPVCPREAFTRYGETVTVEELLPALFADRAFYATSGGGVTLSGGECLLQADFCAELLRALKKEGVRTAVDTCGYVPREAFEMVIPYTDAFLYDVKHIDEDAHVRGTGKSNRPILENLAYLAERDCPVEVRIPLLPGYNDGAAEAIGRLLAGYRNVTRVRLLAVHDLAGGKYAALGMPPPALNLPADNGLERAKQTLERLGVPAVI